MDKRSEIIKMVKKIEDAKSLNLIYILVKKLADCGPPEN